MLDYSADATNNVESSMHTEVALTDTATLRVVREAKQPLAK